MEHLGGHHQHASVVRLDSMPDDAFELSVGIFAGRSDQARSRNASEQRIVDEHPPLKILAMATGAALYLRQPGALGDGRRIIRNSYRFSGITIGRAKYLFRADVSSAKDENDEQDERKDPITKPAERTPQGKIPL